MMKRRVKKATLDELLMVYRDAARTHGAATESGNYKDGNRAADLLATIYSELRRRGSDAQRSLLPFLGDDDPGVRLWSASHALEFAPSEAEAVLRALSQAGKLLGVSADVTLAEWKKHRLQFP